MPRETVDDKALRYLTEKRVQISRIDGDQIDATVYGGSPRPYIVTHREKGWACSCIAPDIRCAHTVAISLLTLVAEPVNRRRTGGSR